MDPIPVFYGIRGEDTKSLLQASKLIKTKEQLDGYLIFKSNQGTSSHLKTEIDVNEILKPYSSGTTTGFVSKEPVMKKGGHVFFSIISKSRVVRCALYKPSGITTEMMDLKKGDKLKIGGAVRKASKNILES